MPMRETYQALMGKQKPRAGHSWKQAFGLQIARVTAIHPEKHTLDVTLLDGTGVHEDVPITSLMASSTEGIVNMLKSDLASDVKGKADRDAGREDSYSRADIALDASEIDVYCIIGYLKGERVLPVCLGYLFPEVTQMAFGDPQTGEANKLSNPFLWKRSKTYVLQKDDDTVEIRFADGTTIIFSPDVTPTTLDGKDFDKVFTTPTPEAARFIDVKHPSGTQITIAPDGKVTVLGAKEIDMQSQLDTIIKSVTENIRIEVVEDLKKMNLVAEAIFVGTDEVTNDKLLTLDFGENKYNLHKHSGGGSPPQTAFLVVEDLPDTTERLQAD